MKRTIIGVAFLLVAPVSAGAQTRESLRVSLTSADGSPTGGALIAVLDSAGKVVREAVADAEGRRTFQLPRGSYQLRVLRIGYRPYLGSPVAVPNQRDLSVTLGTERVSLIGLVVTARAQCKKIESDPETIGTVWAEITKALRSTQLTTDDLADGAIARIYRRETSASGAIISADSTNRPITAPRPFATPNPPSLATLGYVRGDEYKGWEYFGPDERVLLSDEFAATHCFRIVRDKKRPSELGISVDPAPGHRLADVSGTIWVDERTAELREFVFRFVNAGIPTQFNAGGYTRFRKLASGAWLVDEWLLRMPRIEFFVSSSPGMGNAERRSTKSTGYSEVGGIVVQKQ